MLALFLKGICQINDNCKGFGSHLKQSRMNVNIVRTAVLPALAGRITIESVNAIRQLRRRFDLIIPRHVGPEASKNSVYVRERKHARFVSRVKNGR